MKLVKIAIDDKAHAYFLELKQASGVSVSAIMADVLEAFATDRTPAVADSLKQLVR